MTSTRPRRGANAHVARLGAEGAAQLARRQHCQSDGCIYNEDRVVPECFLWATNDMDAAIYCIFDRLAKEINEAARRARYRNLDDEGKRQRLRAAGEDLMDRWGRVVDMFVLRGHHLPDLRRYGELRDRRMKTRANLNSKRLASAVRRSLGSCRNNELAKYATSTGSRMG